MSDWRSARVERVLPRTARISSLFFDDVLGPHRAGQHVDVRLLADDGYEARRSYSIASAPGSAALELMVERLADGEVSPFLHDEVRAGDVIELLGPIGGHFVWTAEMGGPFLLAAGGSGIAPLMAMLRHRATVAPTVPALLLYGVRTAADLVYRDELLAMTGDAFTLAVATSREDARRAEDFSGRIDRAKVATSLQRWPHRPAHAYVCGSTPFVETITRALVDEGIAPAIIRAERYGGVSA